LSSNTDDGFLRLGDPLAAQRLADALDASVLHCRLDDWARRCCPVVRHFGNGVHWRFMQVRVRRRRGVPPAGDLPTLVLGHRAHRRARGPNP
jgi:hypothetical protein